MTNRSLKFTRTPYFKKRYRECVAQNSHLRQAVISALNAFAEDRTTLDLRDHELTGSMKKLRAFRVTDDVRIVYQPTTEGILLLDIGRHQDVYRK